MLPTRLVLPTAAILLMTVNVAAAQGAEKPNDAQIAHIAYTAGEIDIKAAKLALKRSKNKEVRSFATEMVRDHQAVNKKALDVVKRLKVKPEDNPTSKTLIEEAQGKRASLAKLRGPNFDKAYAEDEVAYHQK